MTGRAESADEWGGWRRHVVERTVCLGFLIHPSDSDFFNRFCKRICSNSFADSSAALSLGYIITPVDCDK